MALEDRTAQPSPVLVEHRGSLTLLTLNRPDKLNSFNEAQHRALKAAVDAAAASDTCRAIILTAAGRGFCAGQDLSDRVRPEGGTAP
ncbi:MAG: enoyl-CoA hydratase/isomerase family protein, partial [Methylobacterium sp.]|nr:enoyl-CoA hydratase/isomerase family protein [Methylobacterium sp.]